MQASHAWRDQTSFGPQSPRRRHGGEAGHLLAWYRMRVARKFDGSKARHSRRTSPQTLVP